MEKNDDKKKKYEEVEYLEYDENMEYDEDEYEIIEVDDEEFERMQEELGYEEEIEVYEDEEEVEDVIEEDEDSEDSENNSIYPRELTNTTLETIYIGMLFNNPKAISRISPRVPRPAIFTRPPSTAWPRPSWGWTSCSPILRSTAVS